MSDVAVVSKKYEGRYFLTPQGEEGKFCMNAAMIGSHIFSSKPSDIELLDVALALIRQSEDYIARLKTESVVVDVGDAKETGGLGASQPFETVVLHRPMPM